MTQQRIVSGSNVSTTSTGASFTWIGWVLVVLGLILFIRTRAVTWLLGTILLGLVLMNYNRISPILFKNSTSIGG